MERKFKERPVRITTYVTEAEKDAIVDAAGGWGRLSSWVREQLLTKVELSIRVKEEATCTSVSRKGKSR